MKPIFLLGEARGVNEARIGSGFVGASGIELLRMLNDAGVIELSPTDYEYLRNYYNTGDSRLVDMIWRLHPEVLRSNVFEQHPPGDKIEHFCALRSEKVPLLPGYPALTKSRFVRAEFAPELERLGDEILAADPNVIVCLGNTALWALAGRTGIQKLRGTTLPSTHCVTGFKLLGCFHPAAVLRQWELRAVTVMDLMKAGRQAAFPEIRRPRREIWIEPTLEDLEVFYERHIQGCPLLSVDIETAGTRITCIGFAPSPSLALVIPFDDPRRKGGSYWPNRADELAAWRFVRGVLGDPKIRKVMQNGMYDMTFLLRAMGLKTFGAEHDTMLLSHALQPESLKGLGFLGSIYSDESAWKTDRHVETIKRDS